MSLCAITSLVGVLITVVIHISLYQKLEIGWSYLSVEKLIAYCVLVSSIQFCGILRSFLVHIGCILMYVFTNVGDEKSGTVSGACVSFNGWAMKKRGPVLVSMFSPIGTVCSLVLSVFTLGEPIKIGR